MTDMSNALAAINEAAPQRHACSHLHVAVIMDGNGRWAMRRRLPRTAGHYNGVETVRKIIKAATKSGVSHLTLFGFSSENWKRPRSEVDYLMGLLGKYLRRDIHELHDGGVRLSVIGERSRCRKILLS